MTTLSIPNQLINEPESVYAAKRSENLSSHALADFRKSPWLYRKKQLGLIPNSDSPAYLLGRAAHCLILEGQNEFDARFAVGGPINPKTGRPYGRDTKAFAAWQDEIGKPVLSDSQVGLINCMADGVRQQPVTSLMLSLGAAERVARCTYGDLPCQGRLDWFSPDWGIVDLKTCDDLTWFESDARRYGYAHQLAFYRALVRETTGEVAPVHIIAVEKKEPYRCGVWRIESSVLDQAERENLAAMRQLQVCQKNGHWPTGYEVVRSFDYV